MNTPPPCFSRYLPSLHSQALPRLSNPCRPNPSHSPPRPFLCYCGSTVKRPNFGRHSQKPTFSPAYWSISLISDGLRSPSLNVAVKLTAHSRKIGRVRMMRARCTLTPTVRRKSPCAHKALGSRGPSYSNGKNPSQYNPALACCPLRFFFAASMSIPSRISPGIQGSELCKYSPPYHSSRANSSMSASVLPRLLVMRFMSFAIGLSGSASCPLWTTRGDTPRIVKWDCLNTRSLHGWGTGELPRDVRRYHAMCLVAPPTYNCCNRFMALMAQGRQIRNRLHKQPFIRTVMNLKLLVAVTATTAEVITLQAGHAYRRVAPQGRRNILIICHKNPCPSSTVLAQRNLINARPSSPAQATLPLYYRGTSQYADLHLGHCRGVSCLGTQTCSQRLQRSLLIRTRFLSIHASIPISKRIVNEKQCAIEQAARGMGAPLDIRLAREHTA